MTTDPTPFPPGHPDARWMKEAIRVAQVSREHGDYAFGAVLVRDDKIVTASGNKVITYRDPTGHAELNCLRKAALREGHRHLRPGAVLYCTHAPCPVCRRCACGARSPASCTAAISPTSAPGVASTRPRLHVAVRAHRARRALPVAARGPSEHGLFRAASSAKAAPLHY